jgi:hypothetical protein
MDIPQDDVPEGVIPLELDVMDDEPVVEVANKFVGSGSVDLRLNIQKSRFVRGFRLERILASLKPGLARILLGK